MSDLISRNELIKRFLVSKDGHRIPERDCDNLEVTVSIKDVKTIIKEQPTAYSVDKVIEELEKLADENYKAYCIAFNSDDRAEYDAYTNAIKIVKYGGVRKDVE